MMLRAVKDSPSALFEGTKQRLMPGEPSKDGPARRIRITNTLDSSIEPD